MRNLYLLFVLLCLSGITKAQSGPQFASASFTYERANCNSYQLSFHGSAAAIDTTDAIADYSWYFGYGDSTYHGKDVTFSYQAPGTYMVWLNVRTIKGDTASTFRYVNVYHDSTSLAATLELHQGYVDSLIAYPQNGSANDVYYTYRWYKDDSLRIINSTGIVPSPSSGTYKVEVISNLGCSSTSAPLTYLSKWDSAYVAFGWAIPSCNNQVLRFYGYVGTYGPDTTATVTQVWNFGDGQGWVGENPDHQFAAPGVYAVTLTVYIGQSYQRSVTNYVEIYPEQQWGIQISVDTVVNGIKTLRANPSPWYAKVVWNNGDSSYTIQANSPGTYTAYVVDPCGNIRGADTIYITAGDTAHVGHRNTPSLHANVTSAFPNPSSGLVNLQFARPLLKKVVVSVHNQQGQVLYTRTVAQQSQQLDLSALPKGYYLIVISDGTTRKVQPLILQ